MTSSLIDQFKSMLTKRLSAPEAAPAPATGAPAGPAVAFGKALPPQDVMFRALLPTQKAAGEIAEVSRRGKDCVKAEVIAAGKGELPWTVTVTLKLSPEARELRTHEQLLQRFASKLGGIADGWETKAA